MELEDRIAARITPAVEALGYDLVRVHYSGGGRPTLQVMIDRLDQATLTVDDCATVSRAVSEILDADDPISEAYTLEVSSPGIDRPLTLPQDFVRWAGHEVRIETREPVDGRKRFTGRLMGLEDDAARVELAEGAVASVPLGAIRRAKLVLTDALIAATASTH